MDKQLVARAQGGDEPAFAMLAVDVGPRFHAIAYRILRDVTLAEDAVQQALIETWQDLPQLRDPARFEAWSYRVLVRVCAWCEAHIGVEPSAGGGESESTSHGLCDECTEDLLLSVVAPRRAAPPPARRRLRTTVRRLNA